MNRLPSPVSRCQATLQFASQSENALLMTVASTFLGYKVIHYLSTRTKVNPATVTLINRYALTLWQVKHCLTDTFRPLVEMRRIQLLFDRRSNKEIRKGDHRHLPIPEMPLKSSRSIWVAREMVATCFKAVGSALFLYETASQFLSLVHTPSSKVPTSFPPALNQRLILVGTTFSLAGLGLDLYNLHLQKMEFIAEPLDRELVKEKYDLSDKESKWVQRAYKDHLSAMQRSKICLIALEMIALFENREIRRFVKHPLTQWTLQHRFTLINSLLTTMLTSSYIHYLRFGANLEKCARTLEND